MFPAFLKGYGVIKSESCVLETIIRTEPKREHDSHLIMKDELKDAVAALEGSAEAIVKRLKAEFGDDYSEHVTESYKYGFVKLGDDKSLISYEIHVSGSSSINVYKGDIVYF